MTSNQIANVFTYEFPEVDSDLSIFTVPEEDVMGMEHFLEPDCNKGFTDSDLDFHALHSQKCFNIENFSFAVELDQMNIDGDLLHSDLFREETKEEALRNKLRGFDDAGVHQIVDAIPPDEILNFSSCKDLIVVGLDSFLQVLKSGSNANLSSLSIWVSDDAVCEGNSHLLDDKSYLKSMSKTTDCEEIVDQKDGKTIFSARNTIESGCMPLSIIFPSDDGSCSVDQSMKRKRLACDHYSEASNSEVEGQMSSLGFDRGYKAGSLIREKRLRKPPRRYIEEPLKNKLRASEGKIEISHKSTRTSPCIRYNKQHCQKKPVVASPIFQKESFNGGCIQVPFGLPIEETRPVMKKVALDPVDYREKRHLSSREKSDAESYSAESEDEYSEDKSAPNRNYRKGSSRRKHHVSWTLCEVMKLIEGISQYGVGRWTEIKRLQFSSSPHRTSVDLKDKWRNLLRASETQLQTRKKVELGRKRPCHQVPESVLRRVRELAVMYPYPRESKTKELCMGPAGLSFRSTSSGMLVPV